MMKTWTLQIPDNLDEREAKTLLAAKLYEKGSLSLGQAVELAGYSKRTFMELLGNYEVSATSEKRFATIKQVEIIGEACNHISPALKQTHPEIEWRQ